MPRREGRWQQKPHPADPSGQSPVETTIRWVGARLSLDDDDVMFVVLVAEAVMHDMVAVAR